MLNIISPREIKALESLLIVSSMGTHAQLSENGDSIRIPLGRERVYLVQLARAFSSYRFADRSLSYSFWLLKCLQKYSGLSLTSAEARHLFAKYGNALAYLDVEDEKGNREIGSAFHIGEGVFVSARHVVENKKIIEIRITEPVLIGTREWSREVMKVPVSDEMIESQDREFLELTGKPCLYKHDLELLELAEGPFFAEDPRLDVAVFRVKHIHHAAGIIRLGMHWDDFVYRNIWNLSEVIILGFPPVPMTNEPVLIASRAEIHTHIVPRHAPAIHFLVSATPRGGFSGGVAIHESGDALGVITSSLTQDGKPEELGFLAVLSIEAIVKCLERNNLYPQIQKQHYESLVNLKS